MLKDVKDKLNRQDCKSPEMVPLKDAIEAAKKSGDTGKQAEAEKIAVAYIENFKANHPLTKAVVAAVDEMRTWRDKLTQLDESKVLVSEEGLSEDTVAIVEIIDDRGRRVNPQVSKQYRSNKVCH